MLGSILDSISDILSFWLVIPAMVLGPISYVIGTILIVIGFIAFVISVIGSLAFQNLEFSANTLVCMAVGGIVVVLGAIGHVIYYAIFSLFDKKNS